MRAICKTCGGSPGNHKPSMLDPTGRGNPGHRTEVIDLAVHNSDASTDLSNPPNIKQILSNLESHKRFVDGHWYIPLSAIQDEQSKLEEQ